MLQAIRDWDSATLATEKDEFVNYADDAQSNLQFTVLRAIKTRNAKMKGISIREADLDKISVDKFYHEYWKNLIEEDQLQTRELFKGMSTSDKNIAAQDAFRTAVYKIAGSISARESSKPAVAGVQPDDSVSRAPSEVISEYASQRSGLRGSIESLYKTESNSQSKTASVRPTKEASVAEKKSRTSRHSRVSTSTRRTPVPSQFATSRKSVVASPIVEEEEEMVVDIPSESGEGSRPKSGASKFSRSPPPPKKSNEAKFSTLNFHDCRVGPWPAA